MRDIRTGNKRDKADPGFCTFAYAALPENFTMQHSASAEALEGINIDIFTSSCGKTNRVFRRELTGKSKYVLAENRLQRTG